MTKRLLSPSNVRTAVLLAGVAVLVSSCGWSLWDSPMTTVRPRSDFGKWIDEIFMLISWTTLVIFILVEAALIYACWRFRDRPGAPIPKQVHGHTALEISWTIAFAVILLIIGIPTIKIIFRTQEAPAATALRVDVAGKQWWWEFTLSGVQDHHRQRAAHSRRADGRLLSPCARRHPLLLDARSGRQARRRPPPDQSDRIDPRGAGRVPSASAPSTAGCRMPICASA